MTEPKFICCTSKQISVFCCPRCKTLSAYCKNCSTLFQNLKDLSNNLSVSPDSLTCPSCHFAFSDSKGSNKYLAMRRELTEAGFSYLISDELQLMVGPREEDPLESYRNKLHTIGWEKPKPVFSKKEKEFPKLALILIFLLMIGILGVVVYLQLGNM